MKMASSKVLLVVITVCIVLMNRTNGYRYKVLNDPFIMRGCPLIRDCEGDFIPSRCRRYETKEINGRQCRDCPRNICTNFLSKTPVFQSEPEKKPCKTTHRAENVPIFAPSLIDLLNRWLVV